MNPTAPKAKRESQDDLDIRGKPGMKRQDSLIVLEELNRRVSITSAGESSLVELQTDGENKTKTSRISDVKLEYIKIKNPLKTMPQQLKEKYERMMKFQGIVEGEDNAHTAALFALHRVKTINGQHSTSPVKTSDGAEEEEYAKDWSGQLSFPLPNLKLVQTYETLFLQMAQLYDVVTTVTSKGDPIASRLMVCLCSASLEVQRLMQTTIAFNREEMDRILAEKSKSEKQLNHRNDAKRLSAKRRSTRMVRNNLGPIGRRVRKMTIEGEDLFDSEEEYAALLFKSAEYLPLAKQDRYPLLAFNELQIAFGGLSSLCARFANFFYNLGGIFEISGALDSTNAITGLSADDMLDVVEARMLLCSGIYKFFLDDTILNPMACTKTWKDYRGILRELDLNELNFLFPVVLDNVRTYDVDLIKDGHLDFIQFVTSTGNLFLPNLSASNFLFNLERMILETHFLEGVVVNPTASKIVNKRSSVAF